MKCDKRFDFPLLLQTNDYDLMLKVLQPQGHKRGFHNQQTSVKKNKFREKQFRVVDLARNCPKCGPKVTGMTACGAVGSTKAEKERFAYEKRKFICHIAKSCVLCKAKASEIWNS